MGVLAIWRYPVKAMLGERLDVVEIGPGGCDGDRRWVVVDRDTGERLANKRGPTDPRLRGCRAELLAESEDRLPLRVTLPGGETADGPEIEDALSHLLDRHVELMQAHGPATGRLLATGAFHDAAPVHFVTTRTLAHLRAVAPASDWDIRRLRPNLVLDDGETPGAFSEDDLLGARLHADSGLALEVAFPTPRCVVPTRAHEELPPDPHILRTLVTHHRFDLGPFGRQGCLGAYAEVNHAGRLCTGELLTVQPAETPPATTIRQTIDRLTS
jgi:uncharacterized protein